MYVARLMILELCVGFSVSGFAATQPASLLGAPRGSAVGHARPRTIIEARSVAALVRNSRRVQVQDMIIRGPLDLSYMTINQQVSIVNCEFEDPADFSYSVFRSHLILQNSVFKKGLDLEGATIDLNGRFDAIRVLSGKAFFRDLHVQGKLN